MKLSIKNWINKYILDNKFAQVCSIIASWVSIFIFLCSCQKSNMEQKNTNEYNQKSAIQVVEIVKKHLGLAYKYSSHDIVSDAGYRLQ